MRASSRSNNRQAVFTAKYGGGKAQIDLFAVDGTRIWRLFSRCASGLELEKRLVRTQAKSLSFDRRAAE